MQDVMDARSATTEESRAVVQAFYETCALLYDPASGKTPEDLRALLAPDMVAYEADSVPYGGRYDGPDGMLALLGQLQAHWTNLTMTEFEWIADGGDVFAIFRLNATAIPTGKSVDFKIAEHWKVRDGKIHYLQPYYFDTHMVHEAFKTG